MGASKIKVEVLVDAPLAKAWEYWISPDHITRWYAASDDWHTPRATNDVKVGGGFSFRMEARNKSAGFDFQGSYTLVSPREHLHCLLGDGRHLDIVSLPRETGSGSWRSSIRRRPTQSSSSARAGRPSWTASRGTWKAADGVDGGFQAPKSISDMAE